MYPGQGAAVGFPAHLLNPVCRLLTLGPDKVSKPRALGLTRLS